MQSRQSYPNDLSDQERELIAPLVTFKRTLRGRKGFHSKREMLNALFYLLRTGCQWRHLSHDLPPWKSVYTQFRRWKLAGLFEMIHDHVRKKLRVLLKRTKYPSAGIVDSQSVKTTEKRGVKGYDGVKKVKGRKRHIIVDTRGFLLVPLVTAADVNDRTTLFVRAHHL